MLFPQSNPNCEEDSKHYYCRHTNSKSNFCSGITVWRSQSVSVMGWCTLSTNQNLDVNNPDLANWHKSRFPWWLGFYISSLRGISVIQYNTTIPANSSTPLLRAILKDGNTNRRNLSLERGTQETRASWGNRAQWRGRQQGTPGPPLPKLLHPNPFVSFPQEADESPAPSTQRAACLPACHPTSALHVSLNPASMQDVNPWPSGVLC